jgi:hypothetical protein
LPERKLSEKKVFIFFKQGLDAERKPRQRRKKREKEKDRKNG